jgi:hypothetical protein
MERLSIIKHLSQENKSRVEISARNLTKDEAKMPAT